MRSDNMPRPFAPEHSEPEDLVERLIGAGNDQLQGLPLLHLMVEAGNEIERLRAEVTELCEVFAKIQRSDSFTVDGALRAFAHVKPQGEVSGADPRKRVAACWIVTITGRHRDGTYIREWVYMPERDAKPGEV